MPGRISRKRTVVTRRDIPPFAALRAFEAVGRLGGVREAARALDLNHAVVSRHIRALESWTGVALIDRKAIPRRLTADGARYHERISAAIEELEDASAELIRDDRDRRLHLWCVPGFAFQWLMVRLASFHMRHPEVELNLRPSDRAPDFAAREADSDIRYIRDWDAATLPRHVRQLELARLPVFPVAAPSLLAAIPPMETADDLLRAPLLHEDNETEWSRWLELSGVSVAERLPGTRLWHAHLTLAAAKRGQGIALANEYLLGEELETGRLVRVLPETTEQRPITLGAYCFLAREDRWSSEAIFHFRRWLVEQTPE